MNFLYFTVKKSVKSLNFRYEIESNKLAEGFVFNNIFKNKMVATKAHSSHSTLYYILFMEKLAKNITFIDFELSTEKLELLSTDNKNKESTIFNCFFVTAKNAFYKNAVFL